MCKKERDLHKNSTKQVHEEKPNEAELFFLENEDVLN